MNIRSDHVAGAAFIAFGAAIIALSGDLPTGQLSMPGSGFLPKIVAVLTIVLGLALFVRARESAPFASLGWGDAAHAGMVIAITAAATFLYVRLGFIITMILLMFSLLVIVERRNVVRAGIYSAAMVVVTYGVFAYLLKAPLPRLDF